MTIEELQELTSQEFKFVALDKDDNVKFAVPIPGVDAWQFSAEEQIRDFIWDSDEIEACEEAWEAYIQRLRADRESQIPPTGRRNRTRKQAEDAGAITNMPLVLAIPTIRLFQYSISIVQDGAAHLQPIMPCVADNLRFDNGTLYFQGMDASRIDLVQYYDKQPLAVSKLDLPVLRALYSVILKFSTYTDYDDLSGLDMDRTDGEQILLWEELRRITDQLADVQEYISYLTWPITEVSRLRKGTAGKYWTAKGHYYDCCSNIEALVTDEYHDVPYWTRTNVEHNGEDYYLVGYKGLPMEGLRVRVRSAT